MVKPSKTEEMVLIAWDNCDPDYGYFSFSLIATKSGVEKHRIRRAVRALSRKGFLQFAKGLTDEDGEFRGSGYGLTQDGFNFLNNLKLKVT